MLLTNKNLKQTFKIFDKYSYSLNRKEIALERDKKLLIIKGNLYPDSKYNLDDLFDYLSNKSIDKTFKKFKGKYCGVFVDSKKNEVIIFNDQLGLNDIFYYYKNGELIISDKFMDFFKIKSFGKKDLDLTALAEFLLYEYAFLDRTFIKDIKLLRYGSLTFFLHEHIKTINYWDYKFKENKQFSKKKSMKELDILFKQSIQRIHKLNPNKEFLIGLSGGLDSRIVAKYAIQENMKLHPFVFGNKNSDAFYISKQIAKTLGLNLKQLVIKDDYWKWKDRHMGYDPMMNLMYTSYYSIVGDLDKDKIMLTGFNGDNLFGNHIKRRDFKRKIDITDKIKKFYKLNINFMTSNKLNKYINNDLQKYNIKKISDWNRKELFNFENRQLKFIKNSPSFNFYGKFEENYSMFADIDLVEFVLTLPLKELYNSKIYHDFIKKYHQNLAQIRLERKPYSLLDNAPIKMTKKLVFKLKQIIKNKLGINLPFFNTLTYVGALNWGYLFKQVNLKKEGKEINIFNVFYDKVLRLPNKNINNVRLKYHYLTIQNFLKGVLNEKKD